MIPISDANPTRRLPLMNLTLIGINIVVFLFELQLTDPQLNRFIQQWGVVPRDVLFAVAHPLAARSLHALETLITSQFLHAGWLHIIGNMLFLFIFGDNIEDVMGSMTYLVFYLFCGLVAGLAQTFVLAPFMQGENIPSIGASGAIAGVLGAYIVLYPTARVSVLVPIFFLPFTFGMPAVFMLGLWFLQQFLIGLTSLTAAAAQTGGVAVWAHVGGFVAGMILILPFYAQAQQRKGAFARRY